MKKWLLFVISMFIGTVFFTGFSLFLKKTNQQDIVSPVISQFSLKNAPSQSAQGTIVSLSGVVSWQSRVAEQPVPIDSSRTILQGETIVTGENGNVVVQFPDIVSFHILPNTELHVIQTLPVDIVLTQSSGNVIYAKLNATPVSIRGLDLLTDISQGKVSIIVDQDKQTVSVSVENGKATEGYIDIQNVSHLVSLTSGDKFVFNNNIRDGVIE